MKKICLLACLLILTRNLTAQYIGDSYPGLKTGIYFQHNDPGNDSLNIKPGYPPHLFYIPTTDYLVKSKKQKKAAFLLLAGGGSLIVASFVIPKGKLVEDGICIAGYCSDKYKNDGLRTAFFIAGAAAGAGSIPLFIAAKKNQKRALRVSFIFTMERAMVLQQKTMTGEIYPAAGVQVVFK